MRKIIFRAKRIKTGAWVYGDLVQRRERECHIWSKERGKMVSFDILSPLKEVRFLDTNVAATPS